MELMKEILFRQFDKKSVIINFNLGQINKVDEEKIKNSINFKDLVTLFEWMVNNIDNNIISLPYLMHINKSYSKTSCEMAVNAFNEYFYIHKMNIKMSFLPESHDIKIYKISHPNPDNMFVLVEP